ncbi:MAG: 3-deoxy-7-phosphoheptulonate synthase [Betaproteobacteria bacterium]|nr:3-deoxy-7-phosphoheptulonate synthase [Betaproteobacteria bacterium]NBT74701.1 3-deoxy-7-phosphoheptulonate synthase [Betaproteobacteria bacterium]NBY14689.1 3-deoxy-7-phosphoheptulonate synthase [Betaproteobacteria bacterium]NCA15662.1 3-deoxy-7-phosphoheptulonate synthase [Betaproteobacteria bacterium]NDF04408.1 3-deoxy-7-phosphoheptulonate synthase [Betaproteobacteria bacterium]
MHNTSNLRIRDIKPLITPDELIEKIPLTETIADVVSGARRAIHAILHEMDDRLLVVMGPCSIHDPTAALEYAHKLLGERKRYANELEIVMRVYFEKPRTTVGWKGLINDPHLDNSFDINSGLHQGREVLAHINALGLPAGVEFLDVISPQYIADLVAWGAIGARTTESQVHRELASGLSCPVGFKNGTDGNCRIAFDAIKAASHPHHFLSVTSEGRSAIVSTAGNEDCHVILRGGKTPNYDAQSVEAVCRDAAAAHLACRLMIDMSHGNSSKKPENQLLVAQSVAQQVADGDDRIFGVMVESHLVFGRQDLLPGMTLKDLTYGQSITDGCIAWDDSQTILEMLSEAVKARRVRAAAAD